MYDSGQISNEMSYDEYIEDEDGEYDGYYVSEDEILDEEYEDEEDEEYGDPIYDTSSYSPSYPAGAGGSNPLAGRSPEEVAKIMNEWLDEGHDKTQIRNLGMGLVGKVMK